MRIALLAAVVLVAATSTPPPAHDQMTLAPDTVNVATQLKTPDISFVLTRADVPEVTFNLGLSSAAHVASAVRLFSSGKIVESRDGNKCDVDGTLYDTFTPQQGAVGTACDPAQLDAGIWRHRQSPSNIT